MDPANQSRRGIERRTLLRTLGAGALSPLAGAAVADRASAVDSTDARSRWRPPGDECVIDMFEDDTLAAYVADGPKDNWAVVPMRGAGNQLQFQGGDGVDIRSFDGLENYPRRGEPFSLRFGAYGGWDGYAMFSFGIDPTNGQHRYELEFEPAASELRLQYSRGPNDEETIASTTADFEQDREYVVHVDWATGSDEIVVDAGILGRFSASEPASARTEGGIGFYAAGDAAWTFEDVRLWTCIDGSPVVDDFEYPGLAAYAGGDPTANWSFVEAPTAYGAGALQFQGGERTDIRSFDGLRHYPKRGDRIHLDFGTFGNWDGYAMFSFGIAGPDDVQRRYELEFEPAADELRLQYSRGPNDEETIASTTAVYERDEFYSVDVEWATTTDELVVHADDLGTLRAPVPESAPTEGGVGFYAAGDAGWVFDHVRIANWPQYFTDERNRGGDDDDDGDTGGVGVVDDFEDGDLDEYVARDGPKSNWTAESNELEFLGGDGADLQSHSGLPRYPRRGDRFQFSFGTFGNWDGYAMFSFGIADPDDFQHRYELEFEPASDEVRLQYSRAPGDEETIASASVDLQEDWSYLVTVDWAASGDDVVVSVGTQNPWVELRAPEPDGAPADGGIGFYGAGDAAWVFDDVRILDRTGSDDDGTGGGTGDWPTVQYDFANTGWSRTESGPDGGVTEAWSTAVSFDAANEPAVVDGSVYVTGSGSAHGLYSLNAANGSVEWLYRIDDGSGSPPSVVDGTVYVGGNDLHAHAVDAADGSRIWRTELVDSCTVAPAVTRGAAFFGNLYGDVAVLDASTGDELGNAAVGMIVTVEPAVVDGVLYAASPAGVLGAYDVAPAYDVAVGTSRRSRFDDVEGGITAPTVDDDTVYAAFYNGDAVDSRLSAFDRTDGSERWRFDVDLQASPAVTDDSVYLLDDDGVAYALDRTDGSIRWRTRTPEATSAAPTVADGVVYAGTDSLHALDAETGAARWTYDADSAVTGAPTVVDDAVYVGGSDGVVRKLTPP